VPVELDDESAVVAVAKLFGDDPRLELELIAHVASAGMSQLVEVELVALVNGQPLPQVVTG
jgi:hypothetical protein